MLEHEHSRPRNPNLISDVYDSPAWKSFMGVPKSPCDRIGVQGCSDGFQAHNCGTLSLNPLSFAILSLPPGLRFKTKYMLLSMLLPSNLKGIGLKKYYDFAAEYELNTLYHQGSYVYIHQCHLWYHIISFFAPGVDGIKVKVFGFSMDTIGRHELLGKLVTHS